VKRGGGSDKYFLVQAGLKNHSDSGWISSMNRVRRQHTYKLNQIGFLLLLICCAYSRRFLAERVLSGCGRFHYNKNYDKNADKLNGIVFSKIHYTKKNWEQIKHS